MKSEIYTIKIHDKLNKIHITMIFFYRDTGLIPIRWFKLFEPPLFLGPRLWLLIALFVQQLV